MKCDAERLIAPFHDIVIASPIRIAPERKDDFLALFGGAPCDVHFTNTKANFEAHVSEPSVEIRFSALLSLWATAKAALHISNAMAAAMRDAIERKPYVRKSFSAEFGNFLDDNQEWLGNLISFRDGLAHRIPLYIPPYVIEEASAEQYKALDAAAITAALAGDQAEYDRLRGEQRALGKFRPWMTHSVLDGAPTIVFHKQMLHDYVTVDAYCWTLIEEFDR